MTFERLPLRRVFRIINGGTPTSDEENWNGDVAWATPVDLGKAHGSVLQSTSRTLTRVGLISGSRSVPPGSILVSTRAPIGSVSETTIEMAFNQGCRGLIPRQGLDSRFFRNQLSVMGEQLQALGQGSTFMELSGENLASTSIVVPTPEEQRVIADYLDRETARIDTVVAKKQRMIELLSEQRSVLFQEELGRRGVSWPDVLSELDQSCVPSGWRVLNLSQTLLQLTNGFVGPTRDILVDEGIRYIQSLHIKNGEIDFDRGPFFVSEDWYRTRPRIHLREGDVLIVQTGDIGQVAVVPSGFGEASCHALQICRVRGEFLSGEYLGGYLRTPFGYSSLLSRATGALHPHLEGGIRDIPIVVPPVAVQREVVRLVGESTKFLDDLETKSVSQIELLVERRQALITAAVTGELEVAA